MATKVSADLGMPEINCMLVSLRKESATWTKLSVKRLNTLGATYKRLIETSCSNGIMGSDEDGACLRECGNSNGATHVIGEDGESGAVRDHACGTDRNGQSPLFRNENVMHHGPHAWLF